MELSPLNAEDVIMKEKLPYYHEGMGFFHLQLTHLSTNNFILDHVLSFPWNLFAPKDESLFFRKVFENFFYASLLIITRMATDKKDDFFTLRRFKNNIYKSVLPKYKSSINDRFRQVRFDENTNLIFENAQKLRHQRIAHNIEDFVLGRKAENIVTFGEIKYMRDELVTLFDALAFNNAYMMLPLNYDPSIKHSQNYDVRTDIEKILDSIAERSTLLNLPEKEPEFWRIKLSSLSKQDKDTLNKYRQKLNLSELNF